MLSVKLVEHFAVRIEHSLRAISIDDDLRGKLALGVTQEHAVAGKRDRADYIAIFVIEWHRSRHRRHEGFVDIVVLCPCWCDEKKARGP